MGIGSTAARGLIVQGRAPPCSVRAKPRQKAAVDLAALRDFGIEESKEGGQLFGSFRRPSILD